MISGASFEFYIQLCGTFPGTREEKKCFIFDFIRHNGKVKTSHRSSLLTVGSVSDSLYPPGRDVPADFWLFLPRWRKLGSPWCPPFVR